ncbi:hypothetical protein V8Z74_15170 [Comamonas sp. w2-DMI]|uniref:hypothetical protein n=1 Tax=Comamonas sp. w2-DMI TaxID=3126391 RepID=UPI0032E3A96F
MHFDSSLPDVPSPLAKYLRDPIKGIQPFDVTDALVRSAISAGGTCIHISIQEGLFQFAHDGREIALQEIHSSWKREAAAGVLDLGMPHGLLLAQTLFFSRTLVIASCYLRTRLTRQSVMADSPWELEPAVAASGTVISVVGVSDPGAFVPSGPGRFGAFAACPIPVVINGEIVQRMPRENNPCLVHVEDVTVYVDLASAAQGYSTCMGGVALQVEGRKSIVFMNPRDARITTQMEMVNLQEFTSKAMRAMKMAVGQLLLRIEAEDGLESIQRQHYRALLRYFPEMTIFSDVISSQVISFADVQKQPRRGALVLYSKEMLSQCSTPIFCDMPPVPSSLEMGSSFAAYSMALASDGMFVAPGCMLPVQHWLRKKALSFNGATISVHASGNVVTPREVVYDRIKVRLADKVTVNLRTADGRTLSQSIDEWILTEGVPSFSVQ